MSLMVPEVYVYGLVFAGLMRERDLDSYGRLALGIVVVELPERWWLWPWMKPFFEYCLVVAIAAVLVVGLGRRIPEIVQPNNSTPG